VADFHLDSDVSLLLAPLLRSAGHTVVAARDLGLAAATDDAQFVAAVHPGRILVTHNRRDFTLLHDAWRTWPAAFGLALPPHPGILALDHGPPSPLLGVIDELLVATSPASRLNEMFWWRTHGGWNRRIVGTGWTPLP
jgi:hypothetical protein